MARVEVVVAIWGGVGLGLVVGGKPLLEGDVGSVRGTASTGFVVLGGVGFFIGGLWGRWDGIAVETLSLFPVDIALLVPVVVAAPLLACVATWIPALLAANQDPADVLRHEG